MKISNIKSNILNSSYSTEKKQERKNNSTVQSFGAKNTVSSPLYYKDCFLNKNYNVAFKGNSENSVPKTQSEFINALAESKKYSPEDIDEICKMVDEIIEADQWEETEEEILFEMFHSLALSEKNSDMETLRKITNKICDIEQDYDYIEANPICKCIGAICNNFQYDDYRFTRVFTGGMSGFLECNDTQRVYDFCDLMKESIKGVNPDKYANLIDVFNEKISCNDEKLEQVYSDLNELVNNYGYRDSELVDGLLMHYREKVPMEDIASKLEIRKSVVQVYDKLTAVHIPDRYFFERVFTAPVEELVKRGYTADEIAELLSTEEYCHKIIEIESMETADPVILADFIESIPNLLDSYDVMRSYTKSSALFNNILSDCGGDLDKIPDDVKYTTDDGYRFSESEAKSAINELSGFLKTQSLKRDMTVYRGEGFEVLNQLILENGDLLGTAINNAVKKKDMQRLDKITGEILGSVIVQPHFMSSAYSKETAKRFIKHEGGILWQIDAPKGSNAIYADPFNTEHGVECEILFNNDSALIIKDAKFEDGIYTIYADLI